MIEINKSDWNDRYHILLYYLSKADHLCSDKYLKKLAKKAEGFSPRQIEALAKTACQDLFIKTGFIDDLTEQNLDDAYKKFALSSQILKSKSKFDWKNWLKENSVVIQATSSSLHIVSFIASLGFDTLLGATSLIKNNVDTYW